MLTKKVCVLDYATGQVTIKDIHVVDGIVTDSVVCEAFGVSITNVLWMVTTKINIEVTV